MADHIAGVRRSHHQSLGALGSHLVDLGVGELSISSAISWRLVAISGGCFALPLAAITRYVAQLNLTWSTKSYLEPAPV